MNVHQGFDPQRNSLNFLRLVFALGVVVSHTWPIGGYGPDPTIAGETLGTWAVAGFFGISGFLITNSRLHLPMGPFLVRRVLRIYPAFLVCLLMIALVFAPLSTLIDHGAMSWQSAASFVYRNALLKDEQASIAGTLTHAPFGPAWDGSLWTLFWEFTCYVTVGVMFVAVGRQHRVIVLLSYALLVGAATAHHGGANGLLGDFVVLASFFFAGAVVAMYADRVPLDWRLALLAAALLPISSWLGAWELLGSLPVAYLCLWLGVVLPFSKVGRRNDISYGLYIYAFPVQQILVALHVNRLPVGIAVLTSIAATLPFAVASWYVVEKPALGLKSRIARPPIPQVAAIVPGTHAAVDA